MDGAEFCRNEEPQSSSDRWPDRAANALIRLCAALATLALGVLAVRAAIRLEVRWDTFAYHLPFSALRGGLKFPFEMSGRFQELYEGFPPLPDLAQGLLWRLTGSPNATGVVSYAAFCVFLAYGHFRLRAPFWLVALVSLSAPIVLIHASASYVDLFGNSFLAIGAGSFLLALLQPDRAEVKHLVCGVLGLAAAAWSKFLLVPLVGLFLVLLAVSYLTPPLGCRLRRDRSAALLAGGLFLAAAPYLKNLLLYGNPFWPIRVPGTGELFHYGFDSAALVVSQRPPTLIGRSQTLVFLHSLFEIGHPHEYPDRARWIIDQGSAWVAFRSGGFWWFGVLTFIAILVGMAVRLDRRRGAMLCVFLAGLLGFVACLPQSHELRYYMFLPLTWACGIGLLFPDYRRRFSRSAVVVLLGCASLFSYMAYVNRGYFRPERIGLQEAAKSVGADRYWPSLRPEETHCAVGMTPIGLLLTGPTLREYRITERNIEEECPEDSLLVTWSGVRPRVARVTAPAPEPPDGTGSRRSAAERALTHDMALRLLAESARHYEAGRYVLSIEAATRAIELEPDFPDAYTNICASRNSLGEPADAIRACERALSLRFDDQLATGNLAWARALAANQQAPPVASRNAADYLSDSVVAYHEGRLLDSIEAAARALRLQPGLPAAYNNVCAASAALGKRSDAVRACRIALQLSPDFQLAKNNLAWALSLDDRGSK